MRKRGPYKKRDPLERFRSKVVECPETGCHLWQAAKSPHGYGAFGITLRDGHSRVVRAHRWIYERLVGPIPEGHVVRHRCDAPACVNPEHLETGEQWQNVLDMKERGRDTRGEKARHAKLTESQVREIQIALGSGEVLASVAARYGVSRPTISDIHRGASWVHIR